MEICYMNYSVVLCSNMRPMFAKFLKQYTNNLRDDMGSLISDFRGWCVFYSTKFSVVKAT